MSSWEGFPRGKPSSTTSESAMGSGGAVYPCETWDFLGQKEDRWRIKQALTELHPGRTLESIKGARKPQKYRDLIHHLRSQSSILPPQLTLIATSQPLSLKPRCSTPHGLRTSLRLWAGCHMTPPSLGLNDLVPGSPSQRVQDRITAEYLKWEAPRHTGSRPPHTQSKNDLPISLGHDAICWRYLDPNICCPTQWGMVATVTCDKVLTAN